MAAGMDLPLGEVLDGRSKEGESESMGLACSLFGEDSGDASPFTLGDVAPSAAPVAFVGLLKAFKAAFFPSVAFCAASCPTCRSAIAIEDCADCAVSACFVSTAFGAPAADPGPSDFVCSRSVFLGAVVFGAAFLAAGFAGAG